LQFEEMCITVTNNKKPKPDYDNLKFGHTFTDHMLTIDWTEKTGWGKPLIHPVDDYRLHPAVKVLHYAVEVRTISEVVIIPVTKECTSTEDPL
jgi:branched-chain amino acid aminotransferase